VKILHLEDSPSDAYLVQRTLSRHGLESEILCAKSAEKFRSALLIEDLIRLAQQPQDPDRDRDVGAIAR
jgi:hypothetical protein